MITKERLEELIKEDATIYNAQINLTCNGYTIKKIKLDHTNEYFIENNALKARVPDKPQFRPIIIGNIKRLYEFEKDAKWKSKYQNKTRIEELDLPTWEEFKDYYENISVSFVGWDWFVYELTIENNEIVLYQGEDVWLRWDFNEENYIKACDLCLNLFGGEENDNE